MTGMIMMLAFMHKKSNGYPFVLEEGARAVSMLGGIRRLMEVVDVATPVILRANNRGHPAKRLTRPKEREFSSKMDY